MIDKPPKGSFDETFKTPKPHVNEKHFAPPHNFYKFIYKYIAIRVPHFVLSSFAGAIFFNFNSAWSAL